jgi:hypothetical protein
MRDGQSAEAELELGPVSRVAPSRRIGLGDSDNGNTSGDKNSSRGSIGLRSVRR